MQTGFLQRVKILERFVKENAYTLSVVKQEIDLHRGDHASDKICEKFTLTRTFNFLSGQITTIACSNVSQSRGADAGGSSAASTQMTIQNFDEIQSLKEIQLMHQKLVQLGGQPPDLSEIVPIMNKKTVTAIRRD